MALLHNVWDFLPIEKLISFYIWISKYVVKTWKMAPFHSVWELLRIEKLIPFYI